MPRSRAHTCCTPTTSPMVPPPTPEARSTSLFFPTCLRPSTVSEPDSSASLPANAGDRWGFDVAATGDTYVIGGPGNDAAGADAGEVRIGSFSNPGFVEVLSPDPSFDPARLGTAVVVDGDRMVASAPFASAGASGAGLVYVYERANASAPWALTTSISSPDPEFQGGFGDALDLRGPLLAIGESDRFGDGAEPGRVWVYTFTGKLVGAPGTGLGRCHRGQRERRPVRCLARVDRRDVPGHRCARHSGIDRPRGDRQRHRRGLEYHRGHHAARCGSGGRRSVRIRRGGGER